METQKLQKPFFAKFLESQKKKALQQGRTEEAREQMYEAYLTKPEADHWQTDKYPSDGDEV